MKKTILFHLAAMTVLLAIVSTPGWSRPVDSRDGDPGIWLVELVDPPSVEFEGGTRMSLNAQGVRVAKAFEATAPAATGARRLDTRTAAVQRYVDYLDSQRSTVLAGASEELGITLKPRFVYRHLRNGFAARMSADQARRLASLPSVRSVTPDTMMYVQTDAGPQWLGAPRLWNGSTGAPNPNQGEGTVLGVIDTGVNWESLFFDLSQSSVPVSNPRGRFFGLCNDASLDIPCTDKLIGVYDFTDEGTNGFDPDGHGTHTASTAVGLPLSFGLPFGSFNFNFQTSGVAPRASLISYKACQAPADSGPGNFECPGSATSAALEQAIVDGVDAVNFSIGGPGFNPWSLGGNQRAFLNLRDAGIVPVTSAGNSGPVDGSVGSPANTPWVVAVANASHGRIAGSRLVETSGGAGPLAAMVGESDTVGTNTVRPIVHARDLGFALCGTGPAELGPSCSENSGASNPFPPGTFNGEIVVCDRGNYGRIEKGKNVQAAGAGGMILANTAEQGEATDADTHCLPATHVGADDGDRLRNWLATGSGHRGRLGGAERVVDPDRAGLINRSSSRGPASGSPDTMKPNVTAPGTRVLAASTQLDAAGTGPGADAALQVAFLSGTSMSSPHVAGAALLLRASHPEWGVDEIISALETTADASMVRQSDGAPARVIDRGAGGVQVDRAAQIGLYLPVSRAEFVNANPAVGGDPGKLNLPGVFSDGCEDVCSFTRTVRALGPGTWSVSTDGELAIEVSPASFSLQQGQQQQLQITIRAGATPFGRWGAGSIILDTPNPNFIRQRLPVGILVSGGSIPESRSFATETNRGRGSLELSNLLAVSELVIRTSALVRPEARTPMLQEDPTPFEAFDDEVGTSTELFEVDQGSILLFAQTFASSSQDVDLFVGRDDNGNGQADEFEERCSSRSFDDLEFCRIDEPEAGSWWVRVQNFADPDSSDSGTSDSAPFEFAVFAEQRDPSLVAFGPGIHPGGPLSIPVYWDQPAMLRNQRWVGAIGLASSPDFVANIGSVVVDITRTGRNAPADRALFNERAEPIVIAAGTEHRRLFIDVPPTAVSIEIDIAGDIDAASLGFLEFDALADSVPLTPPAPDAVLAASEARPGGRRLVFTAPPGERLDAGRYFVVLENNGSSETALSVTASVTEAERVEQQRGLWSAANRNPGIRQGLDWQVGGPGNSFALWYTFDEAGLPTYYITDSVQRPGDSSYFNAVLFRATSNNERQTLSVIGEVQITGIGDYEMMYAWRINGQHGAEMFDPIHDSDCPIVDGEPLQLLGHWFSPDTAAGGATVLVTDISEAWLRYYFDATGQPRWIFADIELPPTIEDGNRMEVLDVRGWCIYCEPVPIVDEVVGTLERRFFDQFSLREVTSFVSGPPLDTSVDIDRQLFRLSNIAACTNQ
ncbi:MAG: S8 family serine peptidase [Wenzhouxiangellaceae bacterium]|nr:S8 family serine peptidase [Wenzhouxiangellaceae bacterium]